MSIAASASACFDIFPTPLEYFGHTGIPESLRGGEREKVLEDAKSAHPCAIKDGLVDSSSRSELRSKITRSRPFRRKTARCRFYQSAIIGSL
jgi:hypothetical protein